MGRCLLYTRVLIYANIWMMLLIRLLCRHHHSCVDAILIQWSLCIRSVAVSRRSEPRTFHHENRRFLQEVFGSIDEFQ